MGCGQEGGAAFPATPGQVRRSRWPPRGRDPFPLWAAVHTPQAHWVPSLPGGLGKPYRGLWELFLLGFPRTWGPPSASLTPPVYPRHAPARQASTACSQASLAVGTCQHLPPKLKTYPGGGHPGAQSQRRPGRRGSPATREWNLKASFSGCRLGSAHWVPALVLPRFAPGPGQDTQPLVALLPQAHMPSLMLYR